MNESPQIRIFIAEDDKDSRELLTFILEDEGYEVEKAANGSDALIQIRKSPPDLIISDILMPGLDGFDLCLKIKQDDLLKRIPFVFYTATYVDVADRQLAHSLGAEEFIIKPIDAEIFLEMIMTILAKYYSLSQESKFTPLLNVIEINHQHEERVTQKLDKKSQELNVERQEKQRLKQQFDRLIDSLPDEYFFYRVAPDGCINFASPSVKHILGYSESEFTGHHYKDYLSDAPENQLVIKNMECSLRGQQHEIGEARMLAKNGLVRTLHFAQVPICNDDGTVNAIEGVAHDITELRLTQERLSYQANFDSLTKLPNRALARDRLNQAVLQSKRARHSMGVLFIDLDRFKQINDSQGHQAGDELLIKVSRRMEVCVRDEDTLARLGGDEFMIIVTNIKAASALETVARKVLDVFNTSFEIRKKECFISASIGITMYPVDGDTPETLSSHADIAMYKAKNSGRNTYRFFTQEMDEQAKKHTEMESYLRYALPRGELGVHFQPLIDLRTGELLGDEALARWTHPLLGKVSPVNFIPLAEETGLINPIGEWVLHQACSHAKLKRENDATNYYVSVNISERQFRGENLMETIEHALEKHQLPAEALMLEVTESLLMKDIPESMRFFNEIREIGVRLSIDDFGTGYSSLSYLKKFPFSHLKIDCSFIRDILISADDAILTKTIIHMAHDLGLKVVAEGIETEAQQNFLLQHGCDIGQGYLYA